MLAEVDTNTVALAAEARTAETVAKLDEIKLDGACPPAWANAVSFFIALTHAHTVPRRLCLPRRTVDTRCRELEECCEAAVRQMKNEMFLQIMKLPKHVQQMTMNQLMEDFGGSLDAAIQRRDAADPLAGQRCVCARAACCCPRVHTRWAHDGCNGSASRAEGVAASGVPRSGAKRMRPAGARAAAAVATGGAVPMSAAKVRVVLVLPPNCALTGVVVHQRRRETAQTPARPLPVPATPAAVAAASFMVRDNPCSARAAPRSQHRAAADAGRREQGCGHAHGALDATRAACRVCLHR